MTSTEENAYKMIYNWTMEELLKLIDANNTFYKEDSFYLGGSRLYIPPQDWYTVIEDLANPDRRWRVKFLYNMSKLGEKDKEYIGEAGCLNNLFGIPLSKGIIVG
jgi:hypothetical protein